jgi:dihydrofolate reductase
MNKLMAHISMSLDGFIAGPHPAPDNPLGDNGHALHDWLFDYPDTPYNHEVVKTFREEYGAIIMGRTMYDESLPWWDGTGPQGDDVPCFVLTRKGTEPKDAAKVFTFVTEGIEKAYELAKAAAGDKDVMINGGANTIQQYVKARMVDELRISLVPILLGGGTSLFGSLGEYIQLEQIHADDEKVVTHLSYRLKETIAHRS